MSAREPLPASPEPPALPPALLDGLRKGEQLEEILEQLVAAGQPGSLLPSERELAEHYRVARMTVRSALSSLVAKGLIYRVQGQGTFVARRRIIQPATLTSFSEDMRARGMRPGSPVLGQEVVLASAQIAASLHLSVDDPVVRIERIRLGDGEPVAVERAHMPARRFPGLVDADLEHSSLYALLAERYDCHVAEADQWVAAVRLTEVEALLLGAEQGSPALQIERATRDQHGEVIEFVRSIYRGDRYELRTRLRRETPFRSAPDS